MPKLDVSRRSFLTGALATTAGAVVTSRARAADPELEGAASAHDVVSMSCTVNGTAVREEVGPDTTALDVIRDRLGLTGTKYSCGHGACGACACHVDGTPVATCLLPATSLHGATVTTIEGLGEALHPVQRAFMAEDALQCGFCTPGFVMEAVAFHDAWRKEHGTAEPDRDTVAAALSGHLCRCGAYHTIYRAVQGACAGRFDTGEVWPARVDALAKVTGKARFTVDVVLPGQLEGVFLRSPHAAATVRSVDTSAAEALAGVHAVTRFVQDGGSVRFAGQEILAIAADDRHIARRATELVRVVYDVAAPVIGVDAAVKPGAPVVYPGRRDRRKLPLASEGGLTPAGWEGNVRGPFRMPFVGGGRARRRIAAIEAGETRGTVVSGRWETQVQVHSALEPHACVAHLDGTGKLTVYLSTQAVSHMPKDIAQRYGLSQRDVRVVCEYAGGAFGAKATLQLEAIAAIDLAIATARPVRVFNDRWEELLTGGLRPGVRSDIKLAAGEGGVPAAMQLEARADAGVSVGASIGPTAVLVYPDAAKAVSDYDIVTNAAPGRPFRGPGGMQAFWAVESAMDVLADRLGDDPIALRRKWDPNPIRGRLYSWIEGLDIWRGRGARAKDKGRFKRGVGLAVASWMYILEHAELELELGSDGRLVASSGSQDMGNGTRSTIAHAVAQHLGVRPGRVEVRLGDSESAHGPLSGGSRTTPSLMPVAEDAVDQLTRELVAVAADHWGLEDARWEAGAVVHAGGRKTLEEVAALTPGIKVIGRRKRDDRAMLLPFALPTGMRVGRTVGVSTQVAEVEIDSRLGKVRVTATYSGFGVGRILSKRLALSQCEGAVCQAVGYSLYEERRLDPVTGVQLTAGLEDYRITGIGDMPETIVVHFDEAGFEFVNGGGIGISELANVAVPAAIGNAVFHATGWRPRALPLRPDRVLEGLA